MDTFRIQNLKLNEFENISSEEIKKLFLEGTKEAKEKIFKSNIKLIKYVLGTFPKNVIKQNYDDFFQEASIGLLKAIEKFNLDYNVEFSTYAVSMIKGEIKRYLRDRKSLVKPSRKASDLKYRIELLNQLYEKKCGRRLSTKTLATLLNSSEYEIAAALENNNVLSMESPITNQADDNLSIEDMIGVNDDISHVEVKLIVEKVLNKYEENKKNAIIEYYTGFITQTELAKKLNISQAQVSRILRQFQFELLKELDYKPNYINKEKQNNKIKQTIYEKISFYDKKMIDDTIDEIFNDEEKEILLCCYPKSATNLKKGMQSQIQRAYSLLEMLIYQMAKKIVEGSDIMINKEKNNKEQKNGEKKDLQDKFFENFEGYNKEDVLDAINQLSDKNKLIIEYLYGLNGKDKKGINEISTLLNKTPNSIYQAHYNIKKMIKNILSGNQKVKLQKENKYQGKRVRRNKFDEILKNIDEKTIDLATSGLSKKQILSFKYYYLDNMSIEEIAKKLDLSNSTVNNYAYLCRCKIINYLKQEDIYKQKKEEEKKRITTINKKVNSVKNINSINEIYELIKNNDEEVLNTKFILNGNALYVNKTIGNCTLSNADIFLGKMYEKGKITKKCFIYKITQLDSENNIIDENILIKDKNIKKYYKYVSKNNNSFDFSGIENDEIVCYEITCEEEIEINNEKKDNIKKIPLDSYIGNLFKKARQLRDGSPNELKESLDIYIKLLNMTQDNNLLYLANYQIALIYQKRNKLLLAEKYYNEALKYNADYKTLFKLGENYILQEKYNEALKTFLECEKLNNKAYAHKNKIALCYHYIGNDDIALKSIDKVLENNQNNHYTFYDKAIILFDMGKYDEVISILGKIKENDLYAHKNGMLACYLLEAKSRYLIGERKKAIEIFDYITQSNINDNNFYGLLRIGLFFHELGDKDLAYKYYLQLPRFKKWADLTDDEINEHYIKHNEEINLDDMHSVFNFNISLEEMQKLIDNIEKTDTRILYDVYQIKWPNVGYMKPEEKSINLDYISIFTLPFTKKIVMAYPDFELTNKYSKPLSIDEVRKLNNTKLDNNEQRQDVLSVDVNNIEETNTNDEPNIRYVDKDELNSKMNTNTIKDLKLVDYEIFNQNKDNFKLLINTLSDSKKQVLLLLALGYVDNKVFTIEELASMFNTTFDDIIENLNDALNTIMSFASCAINSTIGITKKLSINNIPNKNTGK